ncbi:TonB-dependent receptor [Gilvibacter sediminis]|uniref:TonB-dependent receptor n=1 Tax=Gilvibacter sediminis TaxID=379071 RepID=UPI002350C873|nr:carboxypeptidase-like regulatory domain-containing protein [Gilvibacter sediminis]MDC7997052.1 carboxypeptidase-like regulatory domain-containing protein [Gilvibacter sediminis]
MRNKLLLFSFLLMGFSLTAQNLSGTIQDASATPLQDVVVINTTNNTHTHTDANGYFELSEFKQTDTIQFSHIGYETLSFTAADFNQKPNNLWVLEASRLSLDQIVISPGVPLDVQMVDVDLKLNPEQSSQKLLQRVPGLFIGQHAGGGKAEQIFLRGFDIDHGTDINLSVDGLPVNMVSHAHGQGYSDLHFVIPETLSNIDFGKGPYEAHRGDFTTAGYVAFNTKDRIDRSSISVSYGDFASFRTVGLFKLLDEDKTQAYAAGSFNAFDGPFISPQNFNRVNLFTKFNTRISNEEKLEITASHFSSKWTASGQIPWRAVRSGQIDRFGAIDDTEGGNTSRSNLVFNHFKRLNNGGKLNSTLYYSRYDFELFSNFTFFLENPVDGDQIRQFEDRELMGFQTTLDHKFNFGQQVVKYQIGAGLRYDNVDDLELSRTKNRKETLEQLAFGDVDQTHGFLFASANITLGKWRFNPGLRLDGFQFDYTDRLSPTFSNQTATTLRLSPKFNLFYQPKSELQFYLKNGLGFHSNDSRVSVTPGAVDSTLPKAFGTDLGLNFKPSEKLFVNFALWHLYLEQEFVYVGDEAVVEPSGETRRLGFDLGLRYQPTPWLYLQQDLNYAYARSLEAPSGEDRIPLAPSWTATGSATVDLTNGFSGGLRYRFIDDRPANEDNSIVAAGYFITDANIAYSVGNWRFGISVENIFDTEWEETQFATNSRLQNEAVPVEEIHFTPGTPRFIRGQITYSF